MLGHLYLFIPGRELTSVLLITQQHISDDIASKILE
jgi:hypothetical protein